METALCSVQLVVAIGLEKTKEMLAGDILQWAGAGDDPSRKQ